jgi:SAM-dependent methyltransferase
MRGADSDPNMLMRDTDADWRRLGDTDPYWGVISHPDYAFTGGFPKGRALDFGCGVGRLAEPMAKYADQVTGVDISPGMLELARKRNKGVTYVEAIPEGPFDWINSFIVFQHITPARGEAIIEELLSKLAPGGAISLQVTIWRRGDKMWPQARGVDLMRQRLWMRRLPVGHVHMYDYDLSALVRLANLVGIEDIRLVSTDHDGHHGVIMLGRKTAPAVSKD